MNLSVGTLMHLIPLPADGTMDFMVIVKEGCFALAHISYLLFLQKVFWDHVIALTIIIANCTQKQG